MFFQSHLRRALEYRKKADRLFDLDRDQSSFGSVYRDMESAAGSWQTSGRDLFDPSNWRDTIIDGQGRIRKPRIQLSCYVTSKGNYVIEWFPTRESDFKRWSDERYGWDDPPHRLLMLRSLPSHSPLDVRPISPADAELIQAVEALQGDIVECLSLTFEVDLSCRLYIDWQETSKSPWRRRIAGWRIREVSEVAHESAQHERQAWLEATKARIPVSLETLLKTFEDNTHSVGRTVKKLAERGPIPGASAVQGILTRLSCDYPELYYAFCSKPPKGGCPQNIVPLRG